MENKIVKFTLEYRLCSVILDGNHVSKGRFWMTHLFQHFDLTDFLFKNQQVVPTLIQIQLLAQSMKKVEFDKKKIVKLQQQKNTCSSF